MTSTFAVPRLVLAACFKRSLPAVSLLTLVTFGEAFAAGTTGVSLQGAYTTFSDLISGYGLRLLILVAFLVSILLSVGLKTFMPFVAFIGLCIFASVGITVGLAVSGAVI